MQFVLFLKIRIIFEVHACLTNAQALKSNTPIYLATLDKMFYHVRSKKPGTNKLKYCYSKTCVKWTSWDQSIVSDFPGQLMYVATKELLWCLN